MKNLILLALLAGCGSTIKVAPVKVEPIHMTIDVNVRDGDAKPKQNGDRVK